MHGFLNINKPREITSFGVVKRLKHYFRGQKVGHLGTLDPMAEGVLPVAVGQATRLVEFLMDADKGYRAEMTLGGTSDTQDAWGNITYGPEDCKVNRSDLVQTLQDFKGKIEQVPPMYSALNYQGQRLYKLARQGIEIEVSPRQVTIHSLELLESQLQHPPYTVLFDVVCSKGTYVRTLCHDIGQKLGCGAYLSHLTRLFSGHFQLEDSLKLEDVERLLGQEDYSMLLPLDFPLTCMPRIDLDNQDDIRRVKNGNTIDIEPGMTPGMESRLVRIYAATGELLALGYPCTDPKGEGALKPAKVFNF